DTQLFTKRAPSLLAGNPGAGVDKNGYYGVSGAAFINYPVSGRANPRGGDEIVGLVQAGYYDGGLRVDPTTGAPTNFGTYPLVPKQINVLAEAGYYNHGLHLSFFGKFEVRKISDDFPLGIRGPNNQLWIAGGLKYYVAFPANFMNF